jgi:hypothetical protein
LLVARTVGLAQYRDQVAQLARVPSYAQCAWAKGKELLGPGGKAAMHLLHFAQACQRRLLHRAAGAYVEQLGLVALDLHQGRASCVCDLRQGSGVAVPCVHRDLLALQPCVFEQLAHHWYFAGLGARLGQPGHLMARGMRHGDDERLALAVSGAAAQNLAVHGDPVAGAPDGPKALRNQQIQPRPVDAVKQPWQVRQVTRSSGRRVRNVSTKLATASSVSKVVMSMKSLDKFRYIQGRAGEARAGDGRLGQRSGVTVNLQGI